MTARRLFILLLSLSLATLSAAQDKAAQKVLDRLAKSYEEAPSVTMDLALTIAYPEREMEYQKATVVQSGVSFFYKADEQEIYCDGKAVWYYIRERDEVQINDYEEGDDGGAMTPTGILQQYRDKEMSYAITKENGPLVSIELIPKDEYSEYAKYRVTVDKSKNELQSVEMMGKDGSKVTVDAKHIDLSKKYAETDFQFDTKKHPSIKVEDLRF